MVRRVVYTSVATSGPSRNAYRDSAELVVRPGAQLPDICMHCGRPARGNVLHKKLPDTFGVWFIVLPPPLDVIVDALVRGCYGFDFPFCPTCLPDHSHLFPGRLDDHLAVFGVVSRALLDSLPPMPPDVAVEKKRTWLQRKFRWLYR